MMREVEELRSAADGLVRSLDAMGHVLSPEGEVARERLRAAVAATPTEMVTVPMGQVGPDGWVVKPA